MQAKPWALSVNPDLVIEGILPFANPRGFRKMMRMVGGMDDKALRNGGLFTMLAGLVLLYLVR